MIYNLGNALAYAIIENGGSTYGFNTYNPRMVIYSGTMPSVSDYATNWSTSYHWHGTDNSLNGTSVLGYYDIYSLNRTDSTLYNSSTPGSTYIADGTATWAALWPGSNNANKWGVTGSTDSNIASDSYILVPVTDLTGTGVIKLNGTTVSSSMPEFGSFTLTIGTT